MENNLTTMLFSLTTVVTVFSLTHAAPSASIWAIHERRQHGNSAWVARSSEVDGRTIIPLSIGLTQRNLEKGHDFLMGVSDPVSPNYGKHWTQQQIAETFAPSTETVDEVTAWLLGSGIEKEQISVSEGSAWIRMNATIEQAESLLNTKYKTFEHTETGKKTLACDEYSVPQSIKHHIDIITPTIHFAMKLNGKQKRDHARAFAPTQQVKLHSMATQPTAFNSDASFNYSICAEAVYPECLRALYKMPVGTMDKSSLAVVEYTPEFYNQTDLNLFWNLITGNTVPQGTEPKVKLIDGAIIDQVTFPIDDYLESNLDLEITIPLVYPQKVTLYQVGDNYEGASFGDFLDAIDGSYCTYAGGNSPTYDAVYPDPNPHGYQHKKACGTVKPASVISTSYAYNEADLSPAYEMRQCNEYMKLGLQGITMLFASGDNGVAGGNGECCASPQCEGGVYNDGKSGAFNPSFPSTCPYVTSVGATQIKSGAAITAPEEAADFPELQFWSGGGFSNVFQAPSYQTAALKYYFSHNSPDYTSHQYNNTKQSRGYPDIAANGVGYVCTIKTQFYQCYGTSMSTPVVASLITLINEERIKRGKRPVGFLNPVLYANAGAMNDIKVGGNEGCGTSGFRSVTGWDPVTGLGTPNYEKLLGVFMALP